MTCPTVKPASPVAGTYTIDIAQGTLITPASHTLVFDDGTLTVDM